MARKVRAAVVARTEDDCGLIIRTDALAVPDWNDTLRRCEVDVKAGANVLFD
jgi:2-methylisocitrate lyase-like PEP mutase family enzyme